MDKKPDQQKEKKKGKISGFLPFAIFIYSALAIGLIVILIRSRA